MNKLASFMDNFLSRIVLFGVGFVVGAYFTYDTLCSILFGFISSLCITPLWLRLLSKNGAIERADERYKKQLIFSGEEKCLELLYSALINKHQLTLEQGYIKADKGLIFCRMTYSPLSPDETVSLCSKAKALGYGEILIATTSYHPDCKRDYACGVKITLWDYDKVYSVLKRGNALPEIPKESKRDKLKAFFTNALKRERAKSYFRCGLIIFILSAFVSSSVYYIFIAVACFVLGVTALVIPKDKKN